MEACRGAGVSACGRSSRYPGGGGIPQVAGAVRGPWGGGAGSREEPGLSIAGTSSETFPLACLLPAAVNNRVDSGKHVFLRRLLFLKEVSWRRLG